MCYGGCKSGKESLSLRFFNEKGTLRIPFFFVPKNQLLAFLTH